MYVCLYVILPPSVSQAFDFQFGSVKYHWNWLSWGIQDLDKNQTKTQLTNFGPTVTSWVSKSNYSSSGIQLWSFGPNQNKTVKFLKLANLAI